MTGGCSANAVSDADGADGGLGRSNTCGSSRDDDDVRNRQRHQVIHDAVDRNAGQPSNPRSTRTTKQPPAREGSTVPQVQFLSSWTAINRRLFATFREIVRIMPAKDLARAFQPGPNQLFICRSLVRLEPRRNQITESFARSPGHGPGDRILV
jgi:hypothetical protein